MAGRRKTGVLAGGLGIALVLPLVVAGPEAGSPAGAGGAAVSVVAGAPWRRTASRLIVPSSASATSAVGSTRDISFADTLSGSSWKVVPVSARRFQPTSSVMSRPSQAASASSPASPCQLNAGVPPEGSAASTVPANQTSPDLMRRSANGSISGSSGARSICAPLTWSFAAVGRARTVPLAESVPRSFQRALISSPISRSRSVPAPVAVRVTWSSRMRAVRGLERSTMDIRPLVTAISATCALGAGPESAGDAGLAAAGSAAGTFGRRRSRSIAPPGSRVAYTSSPSSATREISAVRWSASARAISTWK